MTEERKHAILFAASLLCARKLIVSLSTDIRFGLRLALLTVVNQFSGGTRGRV